MKAIAIIGIVLSAFTLVFVCLTLYNSSIFYRVNIIVANLISISALCGMYFYPLFISIKLLFDGAKNKILLLTGIVLVLFSVGWNFITWRVNTISNVMPGSLYTFFDYFQFLPALYSLIISIIILVRLNKAKC